MKYFLLAVAALVAPQSLLAQDADIRAWRQDLRIIAAEIPARHPDAFYRMSRVSWDSAVASIDSRLPDMSRSQAIVAFMQLVAMVRDGHTSINPLFDRALGMRYYPVELHLFDDGLYVKSAGPRYASLAGSKVIRIGNATADQAIALASTTIGHENEWFLRAWVPSRLVLAEILEGLGMIADGATLPLVVERNGRQESVTLDVAGTLEPAGHNPNAGPQKTGWVDMRAAAGAALWVRNPGVPYWWEHVRADSTLYVSYRGVVSVPNPTNTEFWRSVFAAADSLPVNRLVLDLRENSGGNSFFNRQVIRGIVARPNIDMADRLFIVTGGKTFSAAMNLALDLERWTNATFVGTPTGNATVFFGDHTQVTLPVSGITVNISSLPWYPDDPRDTRDFIAPRMYTPMTAADYRDNVDPAMGAILRRASLPSLATRVEHAVLAGDTAGALGLVMSTAAEVENRFATPEAEVNALGYRLLESNRPVAIAVFRINTRAFPRSANVWDSYGEALVADGQREAGIAAYKKALEISPDYPSAVAALQRLH